MVYYVVTEQTSQVCKRFWWRNWDVQEDAFN